MRLDPSGARVVQRRWPVAHFATVVEARGRRGLGVVLTGTAAEAGLTRAVVAAVLLSCLDLARHTSFGGVATLLVGARLLVCNDTGISHLATALHVAYVVVYTGDNPARWAPLDGRLHRVQCHAQGVDPDDVLAQPGDLRHRMLLVTAAHSRDCPGISSEDQLPAGPVESFPDAPLAADPGTLPAHRLGENARKKSARFSVTRFAHDWEETFAIVTGRPVAAPVRSAKAVAVGGVV
jgi:hypothetical protein